MKKFQITASVMKHYYSCNHCRERDKSMKDGTSSDKSPWCNEKDTWKHVVQCRNTVIMTADFILESHKDVKKSR